MKIATFKLTISQPVPVFLTVQIALESRYSDKIFAGQYRTVVFIGLKGALGLVLLRTFIVRNFLKRSFYN